MAVTATKRAHVVIPDQVVEEIDALVGGRQRSSFITQAVERELMRMRQLRTLDELVGWNEKDHPELKGGAAKWVADLRKQDETRFRKVTSRSNG